MGVSTDAVIAFGINFGINFGEEHEFPWGNEDDPDAEIEDWWREVKGFRNPIESPWDERGNYIDPQYSPERQAIISAYFDAQRAWDKANPLPVEVIQHCSGDYPMIILAVPGTRITANRGYPFSIEPKRLGRDPGGSALLAFCAEHGIELPGEGSEPGWLLFSYWG